MSTIPMPTPTRRSSPAATRSWPALAAILGAEHVISAEDERRAYETDALTAYRAVPLAVVLPGSTEEVSAVLRFLGENGVKVVARGAGTSLSGGALPSPDCVVVGLARMNRILAIDYDNRVAPRRGRRHQHQHHQRGRPPRLLLRPRPVEPARLHHRRQHRHELRRRALPEIRRHHQQRARRQAWC